MKDEKVCKTCRKPFTWRKKWKKDWANVLYCSERCRRNKNKEKLFSKAALREIGDQIEYRPPTVSGNGTIQSSKKPKFLAFFEFAVITNELFEFLSCVMRGFLFV